MAISIHNAVTQQTETTIHNASVTSTSNSTGVDITSYEGLIALSVRVPVVSGTSPTLDITVETSDLVGSGYATAVKVDGTNAVLTQLTAAGTRRIILDTNALKKFVRLAMTIGGTSTPTFNVAAFVVGVTKTV